MTANSNLYPHESMQSKAYFSPYFHYLVAFLSKVNPKKILKVYVKCGEQREEEEEEEREEKG